MSAKELLAPPNGTERMHGLVAPVQAPPRVVLDAAKHDTERMDPLIDGRAGSCRRSSLRRRSRCSRSRS